MPAAAEQVRLAHYEDRSDAIDGLFQDARQQRPNMAFTSFLTFAEHFSGLSVYNAMLMQIQRLGAVAVAPAKQWARIDRSIKLGATSLVLLQAFGPVASSMSCPIPFKQEATPSQPPPAAQGEEQKDRTR